MKTPLERPIKLYHAASVLAAITGILGWGKVGDTDP